MGILADWEVSVMVRCAVEVGKRLAADTLPLQLQVQPKIRGGPGEVGRSLQVAVKEPRCFTLAKVSKPHQAAKSKQKVTLKRDSVSPERR